MGKPRTPSAKGIVFATAILLCLAFESELGGQTYWEPPSNRMSNVTIDRFIGSWDRSEPELSHGILIERAILRPGDPYELGAPGAVLEYHKKFSLGTLPPVTRTQPGEHAEEEILYIESGKGGIDSGENFWPLEPGYGILIPPHSKHVLINESNEPMTMLILTDTLEEGTAPPKAILVRNSAELPYVEPSVHWNYFAKALFGPKDGLNPESKVLIVDLFPMTMGGPHTHIKHWEEVWCKLPSESAYALLGSEIRLQRPNEAFVVPPTGVTVHSVINLSNKPMSWFYFCHYTINVEYPDWVYEVPSVQPRKLQK